MTQLTPEQESLPSLQGQLSYLERERQYHLAAGRVGEQLMVSAIITSLKDAQRWRCLLEHVDARRLALQGWHGDGVYGNALAVTAAIDSAMPPKVLPEREG